MIVSDKWTYIRKGDRRPLGRVLVAYRVGGGEAKMLKAIFGDDVQASPPRIAIAHWNSKSGAWLGARDDLRGAYAWMPLPTPPEPKGVTR